jgi:uncharacterized protein YvpB
VLGSSPVSRRDRRLDAPVRRRRVLVAACVAVALGLGVALAAGGGGDPGRTTGTFVLVDGTREIRVPGGRATADGLRRFIEQRVPREIVRRRGAVRQVLSRDATSTARNVLALGEDGGRAAVVRRVVEASVAAPVLAQSRPNGCEAAALSILLATAGREVTQDEIQGLIPRSGGLDPVDGPGGREWGDPDLGYVGRVDGDGVAGGFGVYPGPVRAVAAGLGVQLDDLTGQTGEQVRDVLRQGRAVLAWIGLSDGPYGTWRTPSGRTIEVNFGEHTVVVHGVRADGSVLVSNPLEGTRERWSRETFDERWERLGRRGLATRGPRG